MNKVVSLKKLKGDKYLVEIDKSGVKIPHIINENTIVKYHILEGKEFSKDDYKRIIKDNEYEQLYQKAVSYISYQMRTISEVKKHLRKDIKNETIIQKVIDELKSNRYLNDLEYVKEYVTQRIEFDLVGPNYIKDKLISKGIHFDIIKDALVQYNDDLEYGKLFEIIKREIKYPQKKNFQKTYLALKKKCISKGFSLNIIESSLMSLKDDIKVMIDEENLLKNDIMKERSRYDLKDYTSKQKFIKKMIQKGYQYELVKKHVK